MRSVTRPSFSNSMRGALPIAPPPSFEPVAQKPRTLMLALSLRHSKLRRQPRKLDATSLCSAPCWRAAPLGPGQRHCCTPRRLSPPGPRAAPCRWRSLAAWPPLPKNPTLVGEMPAVARVTVRGPCKPAAVCHNPHLPLRRSYVCACALGTMAVAPNASSTHFPTPPARQVA